MKLEIGYAYPQLLLPFAALALLFWWLDARSEVVRERCARLFLALSVLLFVFSVVYTALYWPTFLHRISWMDGNVSYGSY